MDSHIKDKLTILLTAINSDHYIEIDENIIMFKFPYNFHLSGNFYSYVSYFICHNASMQFALVYCHDVTTVTKKINLTKLTSHYVYIKHDYKNNVYSIYGYDLDKICKGLSDYIYYILDDDFKDFKYKNSKKLCNQLFKSIEERKNKYFENNIHFLHSKGVAINRFNLLKHFFINIMNLDVVNVFDDNNSIVCKIAFPNSYAGCNLKTITCEYIEGKTFDKEKYYNPVLNGYGNSVIVAPIIYTNIIYKYNVTSKSLIKVQTHNDCIVDSDELPFDFNEVLFYFLPVVEDDIPLSLGKYPSMDSVNKDLKEVLDKYVNSYEKNIK